MQFFTGRYTVSLDSTGRIAIPAKLRQVALAQGSEKFFVSPGSNKNLCIYSEPGFEEKANLMKSRKPYESEREMYQRRKLFNDTEQCIPDKQGRIMIPPDLRKRAGLDGEVIVTGSGEFMEVWRVDRYEEYVKEQEEIEERDRNREKQSDGLSSPAGSAD